MTRRQASRPTGSQPAQSDVDSLQRGLEILRCFRKGEKSLRLAEIANRTALPRPTAQKLVNTLVAQRFLRHLPEIDRYQPDVSCFVLGHAVRASSVILRIAGPIMRTLAEELEVDILLAKREDAQMMIIESCVTQTEAIEFNPGTMVPIAQTALGRAWLWAQRPKVQGDVIERIRMEADEGEVRAIPLIYRSFLDFAERGYCFTASDWMGDRHTIATPVALPGGRDTYALAAVARKPRSEEAFFRDRVAPALMSAATKIGTKTLDEEAGDVLA